MQGVYITKAAKFLPNDPISNEEPDIIEKLKPYTVLVRVNDK